jgi:hypothetical protein
MTTIEDVLCKAVDWGRAEISGDEFRAAIEQYAAERVAEAHPVFTTSELARAVLIQATFDSANGEKTPHDLREAAEVLFGKDAVTEALSAHGIGEQQNG